MTRRRPVALHRGDTPPPVPLVNLNAERTARRPLELDLQCRDCGKVCCSLAELVGHYDSVRCRKRPS